MTWTPVNDSQTPNWSTSAKMISRMRFLTLNANIVMGYKLDNYAAASNGETAYTDTVATVPVLQEMLIGGFSGA